MIEHSGVEIIFNERTEKFTATIDGEEIQETNLNKLKTRIDKLLTKESKVYVISFRSEVSEAELIRKAGNGSWWIRLKEGRKNSKEWSDSICKFNAKNKTIVKKLEELEKQKGKIESEISKNIDEMERINTKH